MMINTFAKPPPKKQKKAKNNKRPTDQDLCAICSQPYAELHEIFYGPNRQKSIQWGMQVRLCMKHHRIGPEAVHNNPEFDLWLKQQFERQFIALYGYNKFMEVFGENYLELSEVRKIEQQTKRS